ncbi:hypothetical protein PVAP13_2KG315501 [Panicum virgatum]|uniref:Uncharacterized protein n=1 Tax=Panicum virgatum TaxID=38727 RepID=A0A8T0WJ96_PANVG|nr:hypothetical protein PVAP13_2KG315501 [Panicum virgatum]
MLICRLHREQPGSRGLAGAPAHRRQGRRRHGVHAHRPARRRRELQHLVVGRGGGGRRPHRPRQPQGHQRPLHGRHGPVHQRVRRHRAARPARQRRRRRRAPRRRAGVRRAAVGAADGEGHVGAGRRLGAGAVGDLGDPGGVDRRGVRPRAARRRRRGRLLRAAHGAAAAGGHAVRGSLPRLGPAADHAGGRQHGQRHPRRRRDRSFSLEA